MRIVVYWTNPV